MQKLKLKLAQDLNFSLTTTEVIEIDNKPANKNVLKSGRHLSASSYLTIMSIKKKLRNSLSDLNEIEKDLFEEFGGIQGQDGKWIFEAVKDQDTGKVTKTIQEISKDLQTKLSIIHESYLLEIPDAFIEEKEFLIWTQDCSTEVASILAEFLLKGFDIIKS